MGAAVLAIPLLLLAAGCNEEEIKSYAVPHEEPPKPEVSARPAQRLLGAVVAHADRTWFFKLLGPEPAVSEHEKEFTQFIESLRFKDDAKDPLAWQAPKGWTEKPGDGKFRYRTFILDADETPMEFIVSSLEGKGGTMLSNVNRWRDQMGVEHIGLGELAKLTREIKVDGKTFTLVDMVVGSAVPPRDKPRPSGVPTYTLPKEWELSPRRVEFSIATFRVRDGENQADVTISPLPAQVGGLARNVNRWREQVGLRPVSEEEAEQQVQKLDVAGGEGKYADLTGPEKKRILVFMVPRQDATWFFKMTGPAELVAKQKSNFEGFMKSVRFGEGSGGKP
jgi:hypothetical protein